MKKLMTLIMVFFCALGLVGCNNNTTVSTTKTETVSPDYGKVIELAMAEFAEIFKEFENLQIEETSTLVRTDDAKEIVVQIKYSSSNGHGVYGFEYALDDYSNPGLIQHGENITIDALTE